MGGDSFSIGSLYVRRLYARTLIFDDGHGDLDIAAGGVGVGTDLMGGVGKVLGSGALLPPAFGGARADLSAVPGHAGAVGGG